jgi:RNA polymerase sigma factor (sigma-70 family)
VCIRTRFRIRSRLSSERQQWLGEQAPPSIGAIESCGRAGPRENRRWDHLQPNSAHPLTETKPLLTQARSGDEGARAELFWRYREPLARFLHGRLPGAARGQQDTEDIVQAVLTSALGHIEGFEYQGLGSFWRYLRTIGIHLIQSEERRRGARPGVVVDTSVLDSLAGRSEDPAEDASARETFVAFEAALQELSEPVREAVLLRLELGLPYETIAAECNYASSDAARMAIVRGLSVVGRRLSARSSEP